MKRFLLLVLLFFLVKNFFYCTLFRPQENKEAMGLVTQQAARVIAGSRLASSGPAFFQSDFVEQLTSINGRDQLQQFQEWLTVHTWARLDGIDQLELVPQETMVLLDWNNAAGLKDRFFSSRFGRALTDIDWLTILGQLEVKEQYQTLLTGQTTALLRILTNPLFMELFSKRVVIAQLPVDEAGFRENPAQAMLERLLLVIDSGRKGEHSVLFTLLTMLRRRTESFYYQGIAISAVHLPGRKTVYLASMGRTLVLSAGLAPLRESIDLFVHHFVREKTGILNNTAYLQMKEHARGKDDFFLYADLIRLKPVLEQAGLLGKVGEIRNLPGFTGSEKMVFFHNPGRKSEQFSSIVQFTEQELNPFQKKIYTRKPVRNRSLSNMPADLLVYFWSNWLDMGGWWQATIELGIETELAAANRVAHWLEEQTGMAIDEFLALFGSEFGFNVAEISTAGFFPVPRICLCVEVNDRPKIKELLDRAMTKMPVKRDKVAGIPVVSLMVANGMMQPSYALLERFLLLADGRDQIEQVIHGDTDRLVRNEAFQAVGRDMLLPSNLLLFAHIAEVVEGLKEFASWAGTVVAIRSQVAGEKSKLLVDQAIIPLLDGLKMFRAAGVRSYTAPGEVMVDVVVLYAEPASDQ